MGIAPIPVWIVAPFGTRSAISGADRPVDHVRLGDRQVDAADSRPRTNRRPGRRGSGCGRRCAASAALDFEEQRRPSEHRGDVVAVRPQREEPVTVGRRGGDDHQRFGEPAEQGRHLAEVRRDEVDRAGGEVRAGDGREEVRDVAQPIAEVGAHHRPVVQRVHLVDAHPVEPIGGCLDRVEDRHRFAVGQRDDHVRPRPDQLDDGVGGIGCGQHRRDPGRDQAISQASRPSPSQELTSSTAARFSSTPSS